MPPPIIINAAPHTNIYIGHNDVHQGTKGPSHVARMLDHIKNAPAKVICVAMAGAYVTAYLGTVLARMNDNAAHEQELDEAYMQGVQDGFEEGHAVGVADATRGGAIDFEERGVIPFAERSAMAFAEHCFRTGAYYLGRRLLT